MEVLGILAFALAGAMDAARSRLDLFGIGTAAILTAMRTLTESDQELAALTPTVAKVFRLTRMDTVFTIHARSEELIAGLAAAS